MAARKKTNQPLKFYSIHFQGERPYVEDDHINLGGGLVTLQAAQRNAEGGDLIVEWTRTNVWKVKDPTPELVPEKRE